jgi:S-adenosylmethionine:tRNA ribosyltransferase-isomerase
LIVRPEAPYALEEAQVRDLIKFVKAGDIMVFNNTKVFPAEFKGYRRARGDETPNVEISLTLVERLADGSWKAFARPARRLREGDLVFLSPDSRGSSILVAKKGDEGDVIVTASGDDAIEVIMEKHGAMPLPPYIAKARPADAQDTSDYQTVYAKEMGAVAAPTAGLHFTPQLLEHLAAVGVRIAYVTLHVGAGTFLPVKTDDIDRHHIHSEWCEISDEAAAAINRGREEGGRLIAVGTTSLRLLETAAREDGRIHPYRGLTRLFIKPGHRFKSADLLITNFHLPKSTLFMLVCAFSGTTLMKQAYSYAIEAGFRFYSYGDACLLHRASGS